LEETAWVRRALFEFDHLLQEPIGRPELASNRA
jgi:hypothetical protein